MKAKLEKGGGWVANVSLTERRQKYNTYALAITNIKQRNKGNVEKGEIQENNAN